MRYEVTHGKETFHVDVKDTGGSVFEVTLGDEAPVHVDAFKTALTTYSILIDEKQYEGSVHELEDGTLDVHVGLSAYDFSVVDERRKLLTGSSTAQVSGKQELRAQMPGKIVKLLVTVGDQVEEDQGLAIIEAMKMENELKAAVSGTVTQIEVSEGDTVETDALLVVVEPPEDEA